jgi:hypothetical protein
MGATEYERKEGETIPTTGEVPMPAPEPEQEPGGLLAIAPALLREMCITGGEGTLRRALPKLNDAWPGVEITGGDTKLVWDAGNRDEVENARRTFDDLRAKGYLAFSVKKDGEKGEQIRKFDSDAQKLIMVPPMKGG